MTLPDRTRQEAWRKTLFIYYDTEISDKLKKLSLRALMEMEREGAPPEEIEKKKQEEYLLAEEEDSLYHVLGITGDFYDFVADYMLKNGIESVVDIGCAYGHQAECFLQAGLTYEGVEITKTPFYKKDEVKYTVGAYPCALGTKSTFAVSNLCYGYFVHDYESLVKDFDTVILGNVQDKELIDTYFDVEQRFTYSGESKKETVDVYILKRNLEKCLAAGLSLDELKGAVKELDELER